MPSIGICALSPMQHAASPPFCWHLQERVMKLTRRFQGASSRLSMSAKNPSGPINWIKARYSSCPIRLSPFASAQANPSWHVDVSTKFVTSSAFVRVADKIITENSSRGNHTLTVILNVLMWELFELLLGSGKEYLLSIKSLKSFRVRWGRREKTRDA